jgi:hypothetical protein
MEVYTPVTPPDVFDTAPFGLFSAINWAPSGDAHWQGGVQYDADCTAVGVTSSPCISGAPESSILTKAVTWSHNTRGARPFTVFDRVDCSAPGGGWENDAQRASMALTRSAPTQVEATFWSGSSGLGAPVFPNLTSTGPILDSTGRITLQPSSVLISGTPLDLTEGLGRLETALGNCYDGVGVIHIPDTLGPALSARNLCYVRGNRLVTYNGNIIVLGRGYTGTGPDGSSFPGGLWLRATSQLFGYRSAVRTYQNIESFDRSTNTVKMIAEQTFLIGWTCCLAGVLVTAGGEQAGEFNSPLQDT